MNHRRGLLGPIALVLLLAGCASPSLAADSVPPTASATVETPTPTAAPLAAPELALGGDCRIVATEAEISEATGGPVTPRIASGASHADWAIQGLGGMRCAWDDATGNGVWVTVIPTSAVGQSIVDAQGADQPHCYAGSAGGPEQAACSFSTAVGAWWYAGVVYTAAGSGIDPKAAVDALVSDFGTRAASHAADVPSETPGTWTTVPTCDALDALVETTPSVGVELVATSGNSPGEAGPGYSAALAASGYRACFWEADGAMADIGLLPGAWWVVEQQTALPGAVAIDVPGAVEAVLVPGDDEWDDDTVYLSDGANLATVNGSFTAEELGALAVAVMSAVDG